jgi:hypothetical protein
VRRYDATERLVAERAMSTARVLTRAGWQHPRRRRTTPGRRPVNPPRVLARQVTSAAAFAAGVAVFTASSAFGSSDSSGSSARSGSAGSGSAGAGSAGAGSARSGSAGAGSAGAGSAGAVAGARPFAAGARPSAPGARPLTAGARRAARSRTVYRRRRTLVLLILLTAVQTAAAVLVARGFWIGVSVTGFLLVAFVVHLRNRALTEQRQRRAERQYAEWVARRQAAVRREQARRAAARRELMERQLQSREEARRRGELRGTPYWGRAAGG